MLGGRLRYPNEAILGATVEQQLRHITPDRVFLGADGITAERGLCSPTLEQAQLKHAMLHSGRASYVLVDHSKLDQVPFSYTPGGCRRDLGDRRVVPHSRYRACPG